MNNDIIRSLIWLARMFWHDVRAELRSLRFLV
jgi:hypothetical protein